MGIYLSRCRLSANGKQWKKKDLFWRGLLPVQKHHSHRRVYLIVLFTSMSHHSNTDKYDISSGWTSVWDQFQCKKRIGICGNSCKLNKMTKIGAAVTTRQQEATLFVRGQMLHETCVLLCTTLQQCTQPGAIWPFLITWNFLLTLCTVKAEIFIFCNIEGNIRRLLLDSLFCLIICAATSSAKATAQQCRYKHEVEET